MNQFRPSCETAAAAAGGCLFPRCISALPSLRDCGGPATAPITPPQPLPGQCITYWAPLDSVPSVENFAPMEWPSGPAKLAAGTLDWVVKAGYYSVKAADSIRSLATGHWTTDWGVELSRNFCKVSHCPEKAPHYVFPLAENAYYIFNN